MTRYFYINFLLVFFTLCGSNQGYSQKNQRYLQQMKAWQKSRDAYLISPAGWVNLEGLFWLKPGKNTFGSAHNNDIRFINQRFPEKAGYFIWENEQVRWVSEPGLKIHVQDSVIKETVIFNTSLSPVILELGSFRWNIIKREDKMGVRFRNLTSTAIQKFKPVPRYPIDEKWKFSARLQPDISHQLAITNVLGQTRLENSPGNLLMLILHQYTLK